MGRALPWLYPEAGSLGKKAIRERKNQRNDYWRSLVLGKQGGFGDQKEARQRPRGRKEAGVVHQLSRSMASR